jgi:hypothetical protein
MTRTTLARTAAVALATTALAAPTAMARPDVSPSAGKPAVVVLHKHGAVSAATGRFPARPILDRNPTPPSSPAAGPSSAPVTVSVAPADRGIDWATIGIGVAASLLAVGLLAGITGRTRRAHARIAA